jgi:LPS export ABC transporter protein LptC
MLLLAGIYVFFKPMNIAQKQHGEIAQLELNNFTVKEFDTERLKTVLSGSFGKRFADRYEVEDINFTDTTQDHKQNITAKSGLYKNSIVTLKGAVLFKRDDGMTFSSEHIVYDHNSTVARAIGPFELRRGLESFNGVDLVYNNANGNITAKAISGTYILKSGESI